MFPAFAIRYRPTATQPTQPPPAGQTLRAIRSTAKQTVKKVAVKTNSNAIGRPPRRASPSSTHNQTRCGLNASNDRTKGSAA
jgi:hypothetical protein